MRRPVRWAAVLAALAALAAGWRPWQAAPSPAPCGEEEAPDKTETSEEPRAPVLRAPRWVTATGRDAGKSFLDGEQLLSRRDRNDFTWALEHLFPPVAKAAPEGEEPGSPFVEVDRPLRTVVPSELLKLNVDSFSLQPLLVGLHRTETSSSEVLQGLLRLAVVRETENATYRFLLATRAADSGSLNLDLGLLVDPGFVRADGLARREFDVRDLGVPTGDAPDPGDVAARPPPSLETESLEAMVTSGVEPTSWDVTGASVHVADGTLVAWNKPENLDAVGVFLTGLREKLRPQIEERARAFARTHRAFDVSDLLEDTDVFGNALTEFSGNERVEPAGLLAPQGLLAIVTSQIDPLSWGADGRAEVRDGRLVVRNTPENLDAVADLLARLRTSLRARIEARERARREPASGDEAPPR